MAKVIVAGHAGYGTFIKNSMNMVMGVPEGFFFIDFNLDDNLDTLEEKLTAAIQKCGNDEILFSCDLQGGSPFKAAAIKCAENKKYCTVAGINISAYSELVNDLEKPVRELAQMVVEVTKLTVVAFSQEEINDSRTCQHSEAYGSAV